MTKHEFIAGVTNNLEGFSQKDVASVVDAIEQFVYSSVVKGDDVKLAGVTFSSCDVAEHTSRNPKTGESIVVPAKKKIVLRKSCTLKNLFK